jgi:hypothetical protein
MPMTLNGSGTIAGLAHNGLPDGTVTGSDLAAGAAASNLAGSTVPGSLTLNGRLTGSGGAIFNGTAPLLGEQSPNSGGVSIGFDGAPNRGMILAQNASTSQLGFYTKPNSLTAAQLRTLIDENGHFTQYGKIISTSGMPFNTEFAGNITTDGSGNAAIQISGWGWAEWTSYRKHSFVMMGVRNDSVPQFGTWIGLTYHGQGHTTLHTATYIASSVAPYNIFFSSNGNTGQRFFLLNGWSSNTTYSYVIRGFASAAEYIGAFGGI